MSESDFPAGSKPNPSGRVIVAGPSNGSPHPAIFKLNIDCLYEIFELLSLHDLITLSKTCKRLHQAAGDFFRTTYVSKEIIINNGSIYTPYREIDTFIEYIPRISLTCNSLKMCSLIEAKCKSLRYIRLAGSFEEDRIEHLKVVLKYAQTVDFVECPNREEFYDFFLQHCHRIKSLSIKRSCKIRNKSLIVGSNNEWMRREYPTLQHFELSDLYELNDNELETFFKQNPSVRTFSTDMNSLLENRSFFLNTDVQFDRLAIEFVNKDNSDEIVNILDEMFARGTFKRLHIYSTFYSRQSLDQMFLRPFAKCLELLHGMFRSIDQPLLSVKTLGITYFYSNDRLMATDIATNLPNLERIYFNQASTDDILPFIRSSAKLKTIKIKRFQSGTRGFIDLLALNREREKFLGAKKLTIYIDQYFILSAKWSNEPTRCKFVELRRFESFEWEELNANFRNHHLSYYR